MNWPIIIIIKGRSRIMLSILLIVILFVSLDKIVIIHEEIILDVKQNHINIKLHSWKIKILKNICINKIIKKL